MKKLIIGILFSFLLVAGAMGMLMVNQASADTMHMFNQFTMEWDAPTTLVDGSQIPELDLVSYRIYSKNKFTGVETYHTEVVDATITMTMPEGAVRMGVSAVRTVADEEDLEPLEGEIAWSDDPAAVQGDIWWINSYVPMSKPSGLRFKE